MTMARKAIPVSQMSMAQLVTLNWKNSRKIKVLEAQIAAKDRIIEILKLKLEICMGES